jgi:hypothetical protein
MDGEQAYLFDLNGYIVIRSALSSVCTNTQHLQLMRRVLPVFKSLISLWSRAAAVNPCIFFGGVGWWWWWGEVCVRGSLYL